MARLLWKIEFSQLKPVYCPDIAFAANGRLSLFGAPAIANGNGGSGSSNAAAPLSFQNRSFAAANNRSGGSGATLLPASASAAGDHHSSRYK